MREWDTNFIVDEFLTSAGVEGESFDAKSKEILNNTEGRQKVVKHASALANSGGGTMIIGVDDGRDLIQDFASTDESKSDLSNIAQQRTSPTISWRISFEEYTGSREDDHGKRILRLDIRPAEEGFVKELIAFRPNGDWKYYHRIDDNSVDMSHSDIAQFYSQLKDDHKKKLFENPLQMVREETLPFYTPEVTTINGNHHPLESRVTSLCKPTSTIIPYPDTLDVFDKGTMFEIPASITIHNHDGVKTLIKELAERLDGDLEENFGYVVKERGYQWSGKGVENFFTDCKSVHVFSKQVQDSIEENEDIEVVATSTPFIIFCMKTSYGVFWIELRAERWDNNQPETDVFFGFCGILLKDLPFYEEPIKNFYNVLSNSKDIYLRGDIPNNYRQKTTLQKLKFNGDQTTKLENVCILDYPEGTDQPRYVFVDNPLYNRETAVKSELNHPLPVPFEEGVCSSDKIPLFVSGVPEKIDMDNLILNFMEFTTVGYMDSVNDIFLAHGVCRTPLSDSSKSDTNKPSITSP